MLFDFFQNIDIYSWQAIVLLILAGFMVGIINTLAGSGTIISYSLFMLFGLNAQFANGTIRLGVIMQTLASTLTFKRQGVLEIKKGIIFGIPITLGSIVGAQIAVSISYVYFEKILAAVMLSMLFFIFYNPMRWIQGKKSLTEKKPNFWQMLLYFVIGAYGGFVHIGVGIFLLAALVLNGGYDLVRANALKNFVVFMYSPFALAVYIYSGQIHYAMGLISAIGNVFGGIVASQFAVNKGATFIRWFLVVIIIVYSAKLLGLYKFFGIV